MNLVSIKKRKSCKLSKFGFWDLWPRRQPQHNAASHGLTLAGHRDRTSGLRATIHGRLLADSMGGPIVRLKDLEGDKGGRARVKPVTYLMQLRSRMFLQPRVARRKMAQEWARRAPLRGNSQCNWQPAQSSHVCKVPFLPAP